MNNLPFDSKLIPVLREAIVMVQMVLFRHLKKQINQQYQDLQAQEQNWLAGAVVSSLYGSSVASADEALEFTRQHREDIEQELRSLHTHTQDLIPYLTDSLRMQALCDQYEGKTSLSCLVLAQEIGVLHADRAVPLPSTFMSSVRALGAAQGLVEIMPPKVAQES
jgi:hypothetical protein